PSSQRQRRRDAIDQRRPQKFECVRRANQGEGADRGAPYANCRKPCRKSRVSQQERQATGKSQCKHLKHARLGIGCDCLPPVGSSGSLVDSGWVPPLDFRAPCFRLMPCFRFLNEGSQSSSSVGKAWMKELTYHERPR